MQTSRILRSRALPIACAIVAAALIITPAGAQTPQPPPTPTRAPTPTPVAPVARIVTPVRGQSLGGNVTVQGTANYPGFARYELAYGLEPDPKTWQSIGGDVQPVDNGLLSTWNTRALTTTEYALRLQVFGADGKFVESVVRNLKVDNAIAPTAAAPAGGATPAPRATATLAPAPVDAGAIPRAFVRGAELVGLAFLASGAYLILKKLIGLVLRRVFRRRTDYGA